MSLRAFPWLKLLRNVGRYAQAQRRGTVGPGATVSGLGAPDINSWVLDLTESFEPNTGFTLTFISPPGGLAPRYLWHAGPTDGDWVADGGGLCSVLPAGYDVGFGPVDTPIYVQVAWANSSGDQLSPWSASLFLVL